MGTIHIVCQEEFVVAIVITNLIIMDGIILFTLHSILTHEPTAEVEQDSLELNFMQEVHSLLYITTATELLE